MVVELKEKLKNLNLLQTGTKCELIKRLLDAGVTSEELNPMKSNPNEMQEVNELSAGTYAEDVIPSAREIRILRKE